MEAPTIGLLQASHQSQKLGRAGYFVFGAIIVGYIANHEWLDPIPRIFIVAAAALIGTVGALYALSSVRCPKCNLRWVWWSVKHQPHTQWLHWLYQFTECPRCKYRAS